MSDREKLLCAIQSYDFTLVETALYLDGHPFDREALEHYEKYRILRERAICDYEMKYGPMTIYSNINNNEWNWVSEPWPWEMEDR